MAFGNAVGEGFVNGEIVIANKVIVFGPGEGVFIYSGTPELGNPPILSATGGTVDPYGNAVQPVLESRDSAGNYTVLDDGIISLGSPGDFLAATIAAGGGEMVIEGGEKSSGDTAASLSLLSADVNAGTSEALVTAEETVITGTLAVQGTALNVGNGVTADINLDPPMGVPSGYPWSTITTATPTNFSSGWFANVDGVVNALVNGMNQLWAEIAGRGMGA